MLGKKLKSPCPFCGGSFQAVMYLYKAKKFIPHLEAECSACHAHIAWPGRRGATTSELIAIAEQRVPCMPRCGQDAIRTVERWRAESRRVGGQV
jgi:hypothetical protein